MQGSEQPRLNTSHIPSLFFLGLKCTPAPSLPHSPERCKAPSWAQSLPPTLPCCSIFHTLFPCSRVGSQPRATGLQDKPAARGAVVSSGNIHVSQCRSCGEQCGSLPGLVPSKGCREVHAPLESCPGQQGNGSSDACSTFSPPPLTWLLTGLCPAPPWSILSLLTPASPAASLLPGPDTHLPAPWATSAAARDTQAILLLWSSAERKAKNTSLCTQGHLPEAIELHPEVGEAAAVGEDLAVKNRVTPGPLQAFGGSLCGTLEHKP